MERDPVRYVWKHSRGAHLLSLLGVLVLVPVTWLALDMPRLIVDDAVLGGAFAAGGPAPFMRVVLDLPYPMLDEPWVLFDGFALDRATYFKVACATLFGLALVRALVLGAIGLVRGAQARRLAGELRLALFRRMAAARSSARDEASTAADLAGRGVAAVGPFLGEAVMVPVLAASEIALAVVFAATLNVWLGLALVAIVAAHALAIPLAEDAGRGRAAARAAREAELTRAVGDVAKRALAVRIHGTAAGEEAAFARLQAGLDRVWAALGQRLAIANMARGFVREIAAVAVLAVGGLLVMAEIIGIGSLVAALLAAMLLPRSVAALVEWRGKRRAAAAVFDEIARVTGALQARERRATAPARLEQTRGPLVADSLSALDPVSGVRIAGIDVRVDLPAHVALIGDRVSGAETFARLLGGAVEPSSGSLTLAGADIARLDGAARAGRMAYAGGSPVLLPGTLRDNLVYGAVDADVSDGALVSAITVAGLDDEVYALGLAGIPDPALAATLVEARRAVRAALAAKGSAELVDPFDLGRYNRHATVAENLMFGVPVGDTFREANLARHPFMRAVLEAEGLTAPLAAMGLSIARSMVEIFDDVPDGHALFGRFSFFSAGERGRYEDLVARQTERKRGGAAARDRDLLIALALRYVETRHRLGLLDEPLERWIVKARAGFRSLLPQSLGPAVEFYDPDRLCAAASLADNLLFGRAAHDVAGAEERLQEVVRGVLAERGLDQAVFHVGLSARVGEREPMSLAGQAAAVDLARCLVREPDILVVSGLFEDLGGAVAQPLLARLRAAMGGRSLIAVLPDRAHAGGFDTIVEFRQGGLAPEEVRAPLLAAHSG